MNFLSTRTAKNLVPREVKNLLHWAKGFLSVSYFGFPAQNLTVIGVTGTDGKTTTSTLIFHILKTAGLKVALVSTVGAYIGNKEIDTGFHVTTPDPWMLQKLLKRIAKQGHKYVVLEVTSHGLDQHRLFGSNIQIAVLTNVTHEHLDYHKTYQNYLKTKAKIFQSAKIAIINKDDKSFRLVTKHIKPQTKTIPYTPNSVEKVISNSIEYKFPEKYNRYNATAASLVATEVGVDNSVIAKAIKTFPGVPGRMEEIKNKHGFRVIVDFAHTPNALEQVLTSLKIQKTFAGRLIAIFGCASERDINKRPLMGEISTRLADVSIFTAEDPRFEDVNKIISDIVAGAKKNKKPNKYYCIQDRKEAINFAIKEIAKNGDIIVICGKGHEKSMNYNGIEHPWSDKTTALEALK